LETEALSDSELLSSATEGDERAFAVLMHRHEDRIFSLALRMMGERYEALDATQETFIAAYRRASSFRGDSSFSTWLYRIGINTCKDLLRKRKRTAIPTEETSGSERAHPTSIEADAVLRIDLAHALSRLPDDYREAVVMHDVGGVPYEEIAAATGVAIGTVKSRISRGRRKLAELMEHPGGEGSSKG
jgi:RNA polymerase sigma-70 factor (ECF subfamily)